MVRRQKLISMTDRHFEVASKMPNFSKWVREKMDEYIQIQIDAKQTKEYHCSKCETTLHLERIQSRLKGNYFPMIRWCWQCDEESMERV